MTVARGFVVIVGALAATVGTLQAQGVSPTASFGVAIPTSYYADHRTAGPVIRGGLTLGGPQRRVRLRLEGEGVWLPARGGSAPRTGSADSALRSIAVAGSLLVGPRNQRFAPYMLVGGGPQWLRIRGSVNPYGAVPGLHAGIGFRARGARVSWLAEISWHAVLSGFGTGHELSPGTYTPLTLGIEF